MSKAPRALLGFLALGLPLLLAGCPGDYEGGYEKVAFRERTPLARPPAPDPPPFVPGLAGGGAGALPDLPANAPAGVTAEMVEEGQRLYGTVCTACHGAGGAGTPAGPTLDDGEWIHIGGGFDEIIAIVQSGVPNPVQYPGMMPPMGGGSFSEDELRALAAYIFALSQQPGA